MLLTTCSILQIMGTHKRKSRKRFYSLVIILLLISLFLFLRSNGDVLGINLTQSWNFQFEERFFDDNELESRITKELKDTDGEFAVVVESYESSLSAKPIKQVHINDEVVYPAGSLYKLFLMAAVLNEVEEGRLKMDQRLSASKEHLDKVLGGTEYGYEKVEGNITFTVDQALERIARLSDNYAAIILAEKVGWSKVQAQAKATGAASTVVRNPISTTPYDISIYLRNLYQGRVVSKEASQKIVDYLSRSQLNNRIPKQLPEGLKIAHKTGELAGVRHDVYLPDGRAYIIVLMSKNLTFEDQGAEVLARVSKVVYDNLVIK